MTKDPAIQTALRLPKSEHLSPALSKGEGGIHTPASLSLVIEQRMRTWYSVRGWEVDEFLGPLLVHVSRWAAGDERFETCALGTEGNWSLGKGICLVGTVGSSKSTVMECLNHVLVAMGSEFKYRTSQTLQVVSDFKKDKNGGLPSLLPLKVTADLYYDEIGKREIAEFDHYGKPMNIDRLVIEVRYDLSVARYNFHTSTNLRPEDLREYLTEKYYSRLCRMCNLIRYENRNDYRTIDRPRRRNVAQERTANDTEALNKAAGEQIITRFISEVLLWLSNGEPLYITNEPLVYDALVDVGAIRHPSKLAESPYYDKVLEEAKRAIMQDRAGLDERDVHKARELAELLKQCAPGMAQTRTMQARVLVAFKRVLVREFVRVNLDTPDKVEKMFPKV